MKNWKNFIVALTLVFFLSVVSFAGQFDMPVVPPPPPPPATHSSEPGVITETPADETLAEAMMNLIRDFISIF